MKLKNFLLLLSLGPIRTSRSYHQFPPHWKSNQRVEQQPKTVGERIRKRRTELRMFQREAALKIGVSAASLSKWECGKTTPSIKTLCEWERDQRSPSKHKGIGLFLSWVMIPLQIDASVRFRPSP